MRRYVPAKRLLGVLCSFAPALGPLVTRGERHELTEDVGTPRVPDRRTLSRLLGHCDTDTGSQAVVKRSYCGCSAPTL